MLGNQNFPTILLKQVVHDLKNLSVEILLETERIDQEFIDKIAESSEFLDRYTKIKDLVRLIEVELDTLQAATDDFTQRKKVDIKSSLDEAMETVFYPENILIVNKTGNLYVFADDQLRSVFKNLISNSIDAMPQGGKLEIFSVETVDSVDIHFVDQGHGINREIQHLLFKPGVSTKKHVAGFHGTGLWLVKTYLTIMGGAIQVISTSKHGTEIMVSLPKYFET